MTMESPLALRLPLDGTVLIEASAGTGKTHTIADLFVRLLVEGGRDIAEILVVTFTRAATEELRDRIRNRIREAGKAFSAADAGENRTLCGLLERCADHQRIAKELANALTRMDEASVCTIHSFCQQMLQEHAFESGEPFEASFEFDEQQMLETVIEDFWRQRFYGESAAFTEVVNDLWATPRELLAQVRDCTRIPDSEIRPALAPQELEQARGRFLSSLGQLPGRWAEHRAQVCEILRNHKGLRRTQQRYKPEQVEELIDRMDELARQDYQGYLLPAAFAHFTRDGIMHDPLKKHAPPEHPFFDYCQELSDSSRAQCRGIRIGVLREAIEYLHRELRRRKRDLNALSYDDLLTRLQAALDRDRTGSLKAAIRRRYPIALIDEFQDTDPLQYRIFRCLYEGRKGLGLFMIGDPKQAIYSFRGADVFTYIEARRATARRFSLSRNWRSAQGLVRAVNAIFQGSGGRSFVYERDIPFIPAEAAGKADAAPLTIDGRRPGALQVWYLDKGGGKALARNAATAAILPACAAEISRLISLGSSGRAQIGDSPLRAEDIAVLVRSRYEAEEVQAELRGLRIASVFISQESVYASEEALELIRVLRALAEPGDEARLRGALCTRMLGLTAEDLLRMQGGEDEWERWLQRFEGYRDIWLKRGFMAMFQRLLMEAGVVDRILASANGERRMTNLRHLGELLQEAGQIHPGIEELLQWLIRSIRLADGNNEDQQLRLETDEQLVKVVTIHKSKGLQYPVVFLPFAWTGRRKLQASPPLAYHEQGGTRRIVDLGTERLAEAHRLAETERLAEDVRLLYVALTRAQHLCYLPFAPVSSNRGGNTRTGLPESGLGWLLYQDETAPKENVEELAERVSQMDDDALQRPWHALAETGAGALLVTPVPAEPGDILTPASAARPRPGAARVFTGPMADTWKLTSYSRLSAGRHYLPQAADLDLLGESETGGDRDRPGDDGEQRSVFSFPRGREAGNLIHGLMERLDFPAARGAALAAEVERQLQRYGFESAWQGVIETLVGRILDTPLGDQNGFRLREVPAARRLTELEFHFRIDALEADALNRFLLDYRTVDEPPLPLEFDPVKGYMAGFIDLVVEQDGRYYVIDYKSNHLGNHASDYGADALAKAMLEHRYDLQYLIYLVALHRYLRCRLPGYDYDRHFGGVFYLFVRGMEGAAGSRNGVYRDRPARTILEALDALFLNGSEETADV